MSERNKQTMRELWRAVAAHDFDAIGRCYHHDAVYHSAVEHRGRAAIVDYYRAYLGGFPDLRGEVELIVAEGDLVAHRARVSGTHKGEFMGAPATGQQVDIHGMIMSRMVDGMIIEEWEAFDQLEIIKQLGLA